MIKTNLYNVNVFVATPYIVQFLMVNEPELLLLAKKYLVLEMVEFSIKMSETIEVERPDYDKDYIELAGDLNDKDALSSQNLGKKSLKVPLNNFRNPGDVGTYTILFDEEPFHRVVATFNIERIK